MTTLSPDSDAPVRALIYSRISSDLTGEGKSNDRQEDECRRLIDYRRWEEIGVERDVSFSAYSGKVRPAWDRVLAAIAAGEVDVIVAYHLDRLTRNMGDLQRLVSLCKKHDVAVVTVADGMDLTSETGKMVAYILGAVAEQEVERKAARQKLAHKQRRAEGKPWSAVKAFGYTREGVVIEAEATAIREGARAFLAGTTLAEIARRWDAAGLSNAYNSGKSWTVSGVRTVLANPRNAGYMVHDKAVVGRGDWAPILEERTHVLIKAKLADPSRKAGTSTTGRKASNLLTGIARCATCDDTLRAGTTKGEATYICGSWHVSVHRELLNNLVSAAFASSPDAVTVGMPAADPAALLAQIEDLNSQLEALAGSFARRAITLDQLEAASASINDEIRDLEGRFEAAADSGPESSADFLERVTRFVESDDLDSKRALLARHAVVTVRPKGRGKAALRPDQQVLVQVKGEGDSLVTIFDGQNPSILVE